MTFVTACPGWLADLADPVADYSVLDADPSQRAVIDAVLAGRSLVIHGPPGTGKSQTTANLIAAMVARGRKVLFVAEKRAAIDAVLSRLSAVGLTDLVLDVHEGARDRQRIAAGLGATLDQAARAADPDTSALHRRLTDRQRRLARHAAALHRSHEPWRRSAYQVQSALPGVPGQERVSTRLTAPELITAELAERLHDEFREFTRLVGFEFRPGASPWFGAPLRTREQARTAVDLAVQLGTRTLPLVPVGSGGYRAASPREIRAALGNLADDRQAGEVARHQRTAADADIHRDAALLRPVHVFQVEQQRELVHDQRQAGAVGERGGRVAAQLLIAPDRDRTDACQHADAPHVVVQVLAADAEVPERPLARPDGVRDPPHDAEGPRERQPADQRRLLPGVKFTAKRVVDIPEHGLFPHFRHVPVILGTMPRRGLDVKLSTRGRSRSWTTNDTHCS
jgi:AAA domain